MENVILTKENGFVTSTPTNKEEVKKIKNTPYEHLCWLHCANAYISKCQKIADIIKREIDEYDFITDGCQIINDQGEVETFIVTKCANYISDEKTRKKVHTIKKMQLKDTLMMSYFGEATVKEACSLQQQLIDRGEITIKEHSDDEKVLIKKI